MRRPDNWREKREEYYVYGELLADGTYEDDYTAGFEAGADAMLDGILEALLDKKIKIRRRKGCVEIIPNEEADDSKV
jgi:hypothetical protein